MAHLIPDNLTRRDDVPSPIRRIAAAVHKGLSDDAILWFEPPYDPAGERPHFVLLVPQRGIIVFEALSVESQRLLGVLRGRVHITVDGAEIAQDSPIVRARRLADALRARVADQPALNGTPVPVVAGAVLPDISRAKAEAARLGRVLDLDHCIYREDLVGTDGDGDRLGRTIARVLGDAECPMDRRSIDVLRGVIQPDIVINPAPPEGDSGCLRLFAPPDDDDIVRVMDRRQETLAKSLGRGHRVIRGVAGSGKTLVLTYRARLLARAQPTKTFLLTCYTRSLAGQLRHQLADTPNIEVTNIDRVIAAALKAADLPRAQYRREPDADIWARALAAQATGLTARYDGVFVDEAQDFSTEMLRFVVGLLADGAEDLMVVADAAQNIFRRNFTWKEAGIHAQGRTSYMRVNYRNTRQILEYAHGFLIADAGITTDESPDSESESQVVIPPDSASRDGDSPTLRLVPSSDEIDVVVEQVVAWRELAEGSQLAVLYSSTRGITPARIRDRLEERGVEVFWVTDPADRQARDRIATSGTAVVLTTIHSAKGLEFSRVVLCGLWNDREDGLTNRRSAYVGMTRAQDHLAVIHPEDGHLATDLQAALPPVAAPA